MAGSIFPAELTSLYEPLVDGSGAPTDQIGSADHVTLNGGTYDSEGIVFDGVNDNIISDTKAGGVCIANTQDYTWFARLKTLSAIGAVNERWMRPTAAGTRGPAISPLFAVSLGYFRFDAHLGAGAAQINLEMSRDFEVDEEVLVAVSQDFSTKTLTAALYSKNSSSNLVLSGSDVGTVDPTFDVADTYLYFDNTVGAYSHVNYLEEGAIDGTFKTEAELVSALAAWAAPAGSPEEARRQLIINTMGSMR